MPFIKVDEDNFDAILAREFADEKFVVLKFGSYYDARCQAMEVELEELCDRLANVSVLSIDSSVSELLTQKYYIEELPTTLIFKEAQKQLFYKAGIAHADEMVNVILKECY